MKPVAPGHTALAQDRIQTLPIQTEPGFHPPSKPFQSSCSDQRQLRRPLLTSEVDKDLGSAQTPLEADWQHSQPPCSLH